MSLQLIIGASGSGKSFYMNHQVLEQAKKDPFHNYLILVPEQFTMQTQREYVGKSDSHAIMNIDVLSFMRLAYRVFEECPGYNRVVLEDEGKSMVLRKLMQEQKGNLKYFTNSIGKPGFISEVKSVLSEFAQYDIHEEQVEDMLAMSKERPMLSHKLYDLHKIYHAYQEYMSGNYISAEEIMTLLGEATEESKMLRDSVICLDGFTGFTPVQYELLSKLLVVAKKVIITVTMDAKLPIWQLGKEHELFYLSRQTIQNCRKVCEEAGVEMDEPVLLGVKEPVKRFHKAPSLAWLEQNLYRYPWKTYEEEPGEVMLYSLASPSEEIRFVLTQIQRLVREEGYRYREIAIVTGDLNAYGDSLAHQMDIAGVPYFLDLKREIMGNPLSQLLLSLLEVMTLHYPTESVIRLLRTGFSPVSREEIDEVENYLLAKGIRGAKAYHEPWKRSLTKGDTEGLNHLNEIRVKIADWLSKVDEVFGRSGKRTVEEFTNALYDFLVSCQVYQRLEQWKLEWEEQGNAVLAKEYGQIYRIVLSLLDHMVELLGTEEITAHDYMQLIQTGLEEGRVGIIPPGLDSVLIGDIQRTRLKDIRILFVVGVNEGSMMNASQGGGLLTDMDREVLSDKDFVLAPTAKELLYREQFYLYLNLTKPSERLYVTYSRLDSDGKAIRVAPLISKLHGVFPKLTVQCLSKEDKLLGVDYGFETMIATLRRCAEGELSEEEWDLITYYYKQKKTREQLLHYLELAFWGGRESKLDQAIASVLYGTNLQGSISRLEQFASCAFAYYVKYGLQLRERKAHEFSLPDFGNILHAMLENFAQKMREQGTDWASITDEQQVKWGKESLELAVADYEDEIFDMDSRTGYMRQRIERIGLRTIWALARQMSQSDFTQAGYEVSFGFADHLEASKLRLCEGHTMQLQGRIDRIDRYEEDSDIYVNVVDYKTGNKTIRTTDIFYGLQLQLVVYMDAALEEEQKKHPDKRIHPGAMVYYQVKDPVVEVNEDGDNESILVGEMKPYAWINDEIELAAHFDHQLADENGEIVPSVKSNVVPIETTKNGKLKKSGYLLSEEQFDVVRQFVRRRMTEFGNRIVEGDTSIMPYLDGKSTPCDYCDYHGICEFDDKFPAHKYRQLAKKGIDDMKKVMEGGDGNEMDEESAGSH